MLAIKQQTHQTTKLEHWTDLYFKHKRAGYIAHTSDFKTHYYYGSNDVKRLIERTQGKYKQFISINSFDVNWQNKDFSRETTNLKQIRNIAIDIDQYKLNLTIDEVLDSLQALIVSNRIPEPNLILVSHGIQLFYSIDYGASPQMKWLAEYITDQLASKLTHLGADHNAKDMSRVMRVPYSINEKNNAPVTPYIWNDRAYTLQELQTYCRPLEQFETRQKKKNVIAFNQDPNLIKFYRTNYARLDDLQNLIKIRQGDFTGMRNVFLYIFSYHKALTLNTQKDVIQSVYEAFKDVYSRTDKELSKREFEKTVKSAYKDAKECFEHYQKHGNRLMYRQNDGIKKPYKTDNLIKKLSITEEEQRLMRSIRNHEIAKEQHAKYMKVKRQNDGTHKQDKQTYLNSLKEQSNNRIDQFKQLLTDEPNLTNKELADRLGVSTKTIQRYFKKLNNRGGHDT